MIGDEAAAVKGEPIARKDTRTLPVAFLQPGQYQPRKLCRAPWYLRWYQMR